MDILSTHVTTRLPAASSEDLRTAVANLITHYPGFIKALFDNCSVVETTELPRAGIKKEGNHYTLALNFGWLASHSPAEIVFVLCHEAMHRILCHMELRAYAHQYGMPIPLSAAASTAVDAAAVDADKYRRNGSWHLPFSAELFGVATDAVINQMLRDASIGRMPKEGIRMEELPISPVGEIDTSLIYMLLYDAGAKSKKQPFETMADSADSTEEPLDPDDINQQIATNAQVVATLQESTPAGKGATLLNRLVHTYQQALVDWRDQLAQSIVHHMGPGVEPTWQRLDRRMKPHGLTLPGTQSLQAGTCILAHDVSGSIGEDETAQFFAETAAILAACQPERIIILPVDTKVHTPIIVEFDGTTDPAHAHAIIMDAAQGIYTGGGGTSFNPPFEWVEENFSFLDGIPPSQLIYLTDGYGECTVDEPDYPVLWVTTEVNEFPFGEIIELKL